MHVAVAVGADSQPIGGGFHPVLEDIQLAARVTEPYHCAADQHEQKFYGVR